MKPRVSVVLVAKNGVQYLPRTIEGIRANAASITEIAAVNVGSSDETAALLQTLEPQFALSAGAHATFAESVAVGLYALSSQGESKDDLIWILHDDSAPAPDALAHLISAFETGPSVAIAGPKLVDWDNPLKLSEFGMTVTKSGQTVVIGAGQLDQSQFDDSADVLAVSTAGMLVRRSVLMDLAGFDAALSFGDDGLDFCVRARLTGTRVVRVPDARVAHAAGVGRPNSLVKRGYGARRRDQWYRQVVYANAFLGFVRWITTPLVAVIASLGHVALKHPGKIPGEIWAAFATLFSPRRLQRGRQRFQRTRSMPLSTIAPLVQNRAETRATRAAEREREVADRLVGVDLSGEPEFRYWESRAPWMIAVGILAAVILWFPLLSATALTGGGMAPLSALSQLWSNALQSSLDVASGLSAPADAFTALLAVLGSITPWATSVATVWLFVAAIPLAAFGGGVIVGRVIGSGRAAVVGSLAWMLAPPFLSALAAGRLGPIIAHLCIPFAAYFVVSGFERRRTRAQSVTAFAAAALFTAVAVAAAPVLLIVVVPLWILLIVWRPSFAMMTVWTILPSLAMLLPTAVAAVAAGNPLNVLADPGIAVPFDIPSRLTALAGLPTTDAVGLSALFSSWGLPGVLGLAIPIIVVVALGIFALFGSRWKVAAVGIGVYLVFALVAVIIAPVSLASADGVAVPLWTGSLLSVGYLGLVVAAGGAAVSERWSGSLAAALASIALIAVAVPWGWSIVNGQGAVKASSTAAVFPAIVDASHAEDSNLRILTVVRLSDGTLSAQLQLSTGGRLDSANTVFATNDAVTEGQERVATVAAGLVTQGTDAATAQGLADLGVRFVVYKAADADSASDEKALGASPAVTKVATTDFGELWAVSQGKSVATPEVQTDWVWVILRGGVLALFVLLAIPTSRPARQLSRAGKDDTLPMLGGDDDE